MLQKQKISIVIPTYNEEQSLQTLTSKILKTLNKIANLEIIFVNDGSTDNSLQILKQLKNKHSQIKIISLSKNFGQTAALSAGFEHATGNIIVTLDADLQNDPTDIPKLIKKLNQGYDIVSGWRKNRKDPFLTSTLPSILANTIISKVSGVKLHDFGCTLKAYKTSTIKKLKLYGDMHRYIPAVANSQGATITELPVKHYSRKYGASKYTFLKSIQVFLDILVLKYFLSYYSRPIRLFGIIGTTSSLIGTIIFLHLIFTRIFFNQPLSDRPLLLISILFITSGLQFTLTGIIAEISARNHYYSSNQKPYTIKSIL
jgi:glycosyltransferase involved in cell wall biosynthesis